MAKKEKNRGMLGSAMRKTGDYMEEVGTELGLTEQPKVSKEKNRGE